MEVSKGAKPQDEANEQGSADNNEEASFLRKKAEVHNKEVTKAPISPVHGFLVKSVKRNPVYKAIVSFLELFAGRKTHKLNSAPEENEEPEDNKLNVGRSRSHLDPIHGYAAPEQSCSRATEAQQMSSKYEYENALAVDVSVDAGADFGAFSAGFSLSTSMESFSKNVLDTNSERFELVSYCLRYRAGFNNLPGNGLEAVPYFEEQAKLLPKVDTTLDSIPPETQHAWHAFFNEFGIIHIKYLSQKNFDSPSPIM